MKQGRLIFKAALGGRLMDIDFSWYIQYTRTPFPPGIKLMAERFNKGITYKWLLEHSGISGLHQLTVFLFLLSSLGNQIGVVLMLTLAQRTGIRASSPLVIQ